MSGGKFAKNIVGQTFGRLTVLSRHGTGPSGDATWWCQCSNDAVIRVATTSHLTKGLTQSCGCLHREVMKVVGAKNAKHGQSGHGKESGAYKSWRAMLARTQSTKHPAYAHYKLHGITVCDRWRKFENFYADMGDRPLGLTLDRINNDGIYEPGNCRWATPKEQSANTRPRRKGYKRRWMKKPAEVSA